MLTHLPLLAALVVLQDSPVETKGLQILWVPQAVAESSRTTAGFKFNHPVSKEPVCLTKANEFKELLERMPPQMKANGIWISTTNSFLYSDDENKELKALVAFAKVQKIYVFMCEVPAQPLGWKKVDG